MHKMLKQYSWLALGTVLTVFFAVKVATADYTINDENVYFNMGALIADGHVPYRDFFVAHPPLQIMVYAVFIALFGFHFTLLKMMSTVFIMIAAVLLFRLIKDHFSEIVGVVGVVLFLFSFDVLRFSSFNMGINLSVLFVIAGLYALYKKHSVVSGVLFGCAGITRLYTLVPFAIIGVVLLLKNRKRFLRLMLGFLAVFATVNVVAILLFQQQYFEPVVTYHLNKPTGDVANGSLLKRSIEFNPLLYLLAFSSIFFYYKRFGLVHAGAGLYLLFLLLYPSVFNYYFMLLLPLFAILASVTVSRIQSLTVKKGLLVIIALVIGAVSVWNAVNYVSFDLNDFSQAEAMAAFIREHSSENDMIFGDDSITPLIALLSDRRIVDDFADSNNLRFRSGVTNVEDTIRLLKGMVKFFIVYKIQFANVEGVYGPAFLDEFQQFIAKECVIAETFSEQTGQYTKVYEVYDCS